MTVFRSFTLLSANFMLDGMQNTTPTSTAKTAKKVLKTIRRRSFCTLATTSPAGHAHSAGVAYAFANNVLWVHTLRNSHKAKNMDSTGRIGVCVPFRRLPVGPPFTIHFQATTDLVPMDDPAVLALVADGSLDDITAHGELAMPDGCFVRIRPLGTVHSFGPGAKITDLIRDPLGSGAHSFDIAEFV